MYDEKVCLTLKQLRFEIFSIENKNRKSVSVTKNNKVFKSGVTFKIYDYYGKVKDE